MDRFIICTLAVTVMMCAIVNGEERQGTPCKIDEVQSAERAVSRDRRNIIELKKALRVTKACICAGGNPTTWKTIDECTRSKFTNAQMLADATMVFKVKEDHSKNVRKLYSADNTEVSLKQVLERAVKFGVGSTNDNLNKVRYDTKSFDDIISMKREESTFIRAILWPIPMINPLKYVNFIYMSYFHQVYDANKGNYTLLYMSAQYNIK